MDYFAHGFWSYILFYKSRQKWLAVLFGLLPDTLSWFIYAAYRFFSGDFARFNHFDIPRWVFALYNISHSLVLWSIVVLLIYILYKKILNKKFPLFILAAPIAIMMDVPTHSREFLPTPFLWPISDWKFPGFSWGQTWFMILNYAAIFTALYIIHKKKKSIFQS